MCGEAVAEVGRRGGSGGREGGGQLTNTSDRLAMLQAGAGVEEGKGFAAGLEVVSVWTG